MNLRDLKYLQAVAERQHFGKAAEACHVSQPTLSGQVRKLEEFLGVTLFERTNKTVSITPVGEAILKHARLALEQIELIEGIAQAHRDPLAGPLNLGAIPTISPYLMPLILRPLKTQYPQLHLNLSEEITTSLQEHIKNHELDMALIATPVGDPELTTLPLFDEPFWLAMPRDHALYNEDVIQRKQLYELPLLLLADGHCLAQQVMDVCNIKDRRTSDTIGDLRASSLQTILQMVSAGFGCTLVPALAIGGSWTTDTGVVIRSLEQIPEAHRRISLVYRKSFPRMRVIEELAGLIKENLPNTVKPL